MPGIMSWEEMDWMFPDYEDTGLVYHSTQIDNLVGIFSMGLIPGNDNSDYRTIYDSLYEHRPDYIPNWIDPRECVFGWMNMKRFRYRASGSVVLGIRMAPEITQRAWIGITTFSNWIYGPKEVGYFDTEELSDYYRSVVEPVCAEAYWKMSMSFSDNLRIRHDRLLYAQGSLEVLICIEVKPELLSLQVLGVESAKSVKTVMRKDSPTLFRAAQDTLMNGEDASAEFRAIAKHGG